MLVFYNRYASPEKSSVRLELVIDGEGFLVYTKGSGSVSISPEGIARLALPSAMPPCKLPAVLESFPEFSLLHAEEASEVICWKGAITIVRGERVNSIRLPGGDGFWYLLANAFRAPLATFVSGGERAPIPGGAPTGQSAVRMVNYDTGVSAPVPGAISAISPSGRYFASLQGPMLHIYQTPSRSLAGNTHSNR